LNSNVQYGQGNHKISYSKARKIESQRTDRAKGIDLQLKAVGIFPEGLNDYSQWAKNPNRFDISGIDTPGSKEYLEKARHNENVEISPFTRHEFEIWHEKFLEDRANGYHRKPLSVLALEKYIDSRRAAFEMDTGADANAFNDRFEQVDVASASDSWSDLDPELEKLHIYSGVSREDRQREIKERIREEKENDEGYEQFLKSLGRNANAS
jgi:hypothetical protein